MYTTLNEIKKCNPCSESWEKGLKFLGKTKADNRKLSFKRILKAVGFQDAVWTLQVLPYEDRCLFMADVAESVLHIYEEQYPNDKRPREAIQAVRDYKSKSLQNDKLAAAGDAAGDAARDAAGAAWDAAWDAAWAARAATGDAAGDAAGAAGAAGAAARAAAGDAARAAKWQEIKALFIKHFC